MQYNKEQYRNATRPSMTTFHCWLTWLYVYYSSYSCRRRSRLAASVCLWFCLSVCLSVRTLTQKQIIPKCSNLVQGMIWFRVKGQRSSHRVTKCKKAIERLTWVMHSIECPASSLSSNFHCCEYEKQGKTTKTTVTSYEHSLKLILVLIS